MSGFVAVPPTHSRDMLFLLLCLFYHSLVMAKPLVTSAPQLQASSFPCHVTSNLTLSCSFNGSTYSLLLPPPDNITFGSIVHGDATAALDISSNDRSVTDIIWSCLATVFACTWVSVAWCINLVSLWGTAFLLPIYIVARLGLLTQALLALRYLQPGERVSVQWVNLLSHL